MESAIWGFVGTICGTLSSIVTTCLLTQNSFRLQSAKTREEQVERANAFQRQTLLELQESIHDCLRLVVRAHNEDLVAHRTTKKTWGTIHLSDDINEGIRLALRKVSILTERVSDNPVRVEVKALMTTATKALYASSEQEAQFHLSNALMEAEQVLEHAGSVLRSHYEPTPTR